jgi:exodeoxyribonuclease V alpha subunit
VIIIDEMSMVDIHLMYALLKATIPGTKMILVGDSNQLPSVGAGNVLKDMIRSGQFPVVELTRIFRQAEQSDIVMNAHRINRGERLTLNNKSRDFFFLERKDAPTITGVLVYLVRDKLPAYVDASPFEIQVLTPMRKGELGVERLNQVLQHYLNPASPEKQEKEARGTLFREGDKVMQIKNNYKLEWQIKSPKGFVREEGVGVFNGDMGIIREINTFSEKVLVEFDEGKLVEYTYSMLDELELAYAITIHKSQGSEYPAVVMPIFTGPRVLFNRNLLYTAVTRARKCVTVVGLSATVESMIENSSELKRYTGLCERLKEMNLKEED